MEKSPMEELFEDFEGNPEDFKVDETDWGRASRRGSLVNIPINP